jgi:hypothetical protein
MDEKQMPAHDPFVAKTPVAGDGDELSLKSSTAPSPAAAAAEKC